MELTQRLECTQELYPNNSEKEFPDQIGFLGICGKKYPLKKGPNKIGRDPDTCNINLNLNSISRQHAVINILNNHEYMLMDLDSANKTKLSDKTLEAYIPYPLKNGDMVQFGQVFGVFRLFEEDNDLPMTQAIDVPETPVHSRHVSKLNAIHVTTIPESPDVSDRDDSFIVASQPKPTNIFKSPNNRFIKTSGTTISIKPIGTNKIDNVFWSSSKKSDSFSSQSNTSNNNIVVPPVDRTSDQINIHEVNTQIADNHDDTIDSIYNANTQFIENTSAPLIHNMETQVPTDLPEVCKISEQHNLHFNFTTENKENDNNIFNAETQVEPNINKNVFNNAQSNPLSTVSGNTESDEEILFEEIDSQPLQDNFESQALVLPEFDGLTNDNPDVPIENTKESKKISDDQKCTKRVHRLKSDSSTDCEDDDINIAMTQKIPELNDDDITDCEDEPEAITKTTEPTKDKVIDDDVTDCEDNLDEGNLSVSKKQIHDLDTQIIEKDTTVEQSNIVMKDNKNRTPNYVEKDKNDSKKEETVVDFEDLPTQILEEEPLKDICFEEALTQKIYSQEIVPPFKVPKPSPFKNKKKDDSVLKIVDQIVNNEQRKSNENIDIDDKLYYAATQDIFNDLCSQREPSPVFNKTPSKAPNVGKTNKVKEVSAAKTVTPKPLGQDSTDDSDIDDKIDNFVSILSNSQIKDVAGAKKVTSSSSDSELTPKKINVVSLMNTILPNTEEIKNSLSLYKDRNLNVSSESEPGNDDTPVKLRDTKKEPSKAKTCLTKKFENESIPTRKITRIRKPTMKMIQNNDETANSLEDNLPMTTLSTSKRSEKSKETKSEKIKNVKEKSDKNKSKPDETKDSKKTYDKTKVEKRKSENETRGRKKKEKGEPIPEQTKSTVVQANNKKITKDISHYLEITDRRTRSRSNQKSDAIDDKKVEAEKKEKTQTRGQSADKKSHHTKETDRSKSPSQIVRRSRRQRSSKKAEENDTISKANLSKSELEQSAVYNVSSGSLNKAKIKRSATENIEFPSAKKTRTETNSNLSLRATPARKIKTHHVLFTAFPCEEVKVKLEKLGAKIVTDVMQCTVVLTMQIKRTFKLLCALGLGKPIVGPSWVQVCADTNMIVDPWLHLIKDEATEKRFQFNLERSLAVRRGFLKGFNISSTPSVTPCAQEMQLIVECSGGTWKSKGPNWICVSANADKALWPALKKKGAIIVSTEFILAGVLRQRVEIDKNRLA
ncbi:silent chromatin protein ESC1-like [Vanessa cardui]|uniref:silent chromatin protein ESC1-like n=1 Tax=Vanessa cardui TaxID=171605 RepID=UPI001F130FA0|nr:silent chromatin protein ESC1-like [Vanessa cardui]